MHELVGQFAGTREEQQPFRIQIKPTDRLPFPVCEPRELAKHGGSVLRVVVRDDLTRWLVVRNHARRRGIDAVADGPAIHFHLIAILNPLANVCRFVVDGNPPLKNKLLHLQPRTQAGLRQYLVKLGRFRLGRQHPFGHVRRLLHRLGIEPPGHHVGKQVAAFAGRRHSAFETMRISGRKDAVQRVVAADDVLRACFTTG